MWRIPLWFPNINAESLKRLQSFNAEIDRWNPKINLISPATIKEADRLHFADSILATNIIFETKGLSEIYDVGSGNGFPSIVSAILHPEIQVKAVESDQRKS